MNVIRFLFVRELLQISIFTLTVLALMCLFAFWVINQAMKDAEASAAILNKEPPAANQEIISLNQLTTKVLNSAKDFYPITPKILELITTLPPDVKLTSINLDRSTNTIVLSGTAATREALINYQNIIDKVSWIRGITVPTSQLLQKNNLNFDFRGTLQGMQTVKD